MSAITGSGLDVVETFVEYGGVTGTATTAQITTAMQVAWGSIEDHIGTFLQPTNVTDEVHPWPHNGRIMLRYTDLIAVNWLLAKHDEGTCDCDVMNVTGCSIIVDPRMSIIDIAECCAYSVPCANCTCSENHCGKWAVVAYNAGMSVLPDKLLLALVLAAKDVLAVLTGGVSEFAELQKIVSWRSMDYSETRAKKDATNPFSMPSRADMILSLIEEYRKNRPMALANPRYSRVI